MQHGKAAMVWRDKASLYGTFMHNDLLEWLESCPTPHFIVASIEI